MHNSRAVFGKGDPAGAPSFHNQYGQMWKDYTYYIEKAV